MMQSELFQASWPNYYTIDSSFEVMHAQVGSLDFSSSIVSVEDFSDVSSSVPFTPTMYSDESHNIHFYDVPVMLPMEQCLLNLGEVGTINDFCEWMESESDLLSQSFCVEDDVGSLNLSPISSEASIDIDVPSPQPPLVLPCEDMEIDNQLSILHLLKAYGEAVENEQKELAEEIMRRSREKANPMGATVERLAYYLIQAFDKQVDFLRQQSNKNYETAYKAFYQIFPFGRFAHFTANSVILDAVPDDAETVHIIDFDIGKGVQWPPLIEALGRRGNQVLVRLTSMRWEEEDCSCVSPTQTFDDTKRLLIELAQSFGVRLMVEEMDMKSLVSEMKKTKKRGGRSEWLAFNCMVDLPHMGRGRSVRDVMEFLKVAKDAISYPMKNCNGSSSSSSSRGIVTFGDGSGVEKGMKDCSGFGPFFEGQVVQFQALCESMECHFPRHLTEARIAMECLFVAPYVSYLADLQRWEEITKEGRALPDIGLEVWRMSKDNFVEAKELVREGESLYWVRVEGEYQNQMVLGYMGAPLVRVSSWR